MKCACLCALAFAACAVTASAQQSDAEPLHIGSVNVSGSVMERYEFWDFFQGAGESNYNYSGSLLQLAFSQKGQGYDWTLDFAAPVLLGLPNRAVQAAPLGQYGLGASYFAANDKNTSAAGFFVKQGFFRLKGEHSGIQLGRFEFADGMEGKPKDPTLTALRASRIQQHLIGTFGFSDVRRSFDGGHYDWSSNGWNFTAVGAIPTRGVFQTDGWGWVKTPFAYASLTHDLSYGHSNAEWRVFGIYYNDDRPIVKTDNRSAAAKAHDFGGINIGTFGGHYIQDIPAAAGRFDLLAWGAAQTGKWGTETQKSAATALEAGFQPNGPARLKPWIRGGYFWSSGDGNPNDNTHGTFFIMLPTPRVYARFPFYNEMNNSEVFGELMLRPYKRVTFRSDVHDVWLSNSHDLWYGGGGAFQPWTFGYLGRPSNGQTGLATVYDTSGDFQLNRAVSLGLYFGYAQGGAVIKKIFPTGADSKFGFVEMNYTF
jgi:Alginate export